MAQSPNLFRELYRMTDLGTRIRLGNECLSLCATYDPPELNRDALSPHWESVPYSPSPLNVLEKVRIAASGALLRSRLRA
jgi:hypothetical protein